MGSQSPVEKQGKLPCGDQAYLELARAALSAIEKEGYELMPTVILDQIEQAIGDVGHHYYAAKRRPKPEGP